MSLSVAIALAFITFQPSAPVATGMDPVFQASKCKAGYTWDEKKQKCVRKGLDY